MKCYCENGHLIERSPSDLKRGRTRCGKCGKRVGFRALTDLEVKDFEWVKSPKTNCMCPSVQKKSRARAKKYSQEVNYAVNS